MTNNEAIGFSQIAENVVSANFSNESKIDLSDNLYYALKKSVRLIKPTIKEYTDIQNDISAAFKKKAKVDEKKLEEEEYSKKVNGEYQEFLKDPENIKAQTEFLDAEFKGELHRVSIEDIDKSKLPLRESEVFEKYLVLEVKKEK